MHRWILLAEEIADHEVTSNQLAHRLRSLIRSAIETAEALGWSHSGAMVYAMIDSRIIDSVPVVWSRECHGRVFATWRAVLDWVADGCRP